MLATGTRISGAAVITRKSCSVTLRTPPWKYVPQLFLFSIAFYLGTPVRAFVGTAALAGPSYQLSKQESEELSHGNEFYRSQHGVRLERSISGPNDAQSSRCCQVLDLSRTRRAGVHISKVACEASLSRTFA